MTEATDLDLLRARFDVFLTQQRGREAVEMLEGQAIHHQDQPLFWVLLGRASVMDGRFVEAEDAARRAVALEPHSFATRITLLLALLGQERFEEAIDLAWLLVEQHPDEAASHAWLSRALVSRHRDRQDLVTAHQAARHALSLDADAAAFALAAHTASLVDEDGEARSLLAAGLAENPQDRELLLLSGRIKGGARLVGPREELVGGLLRASPLDTSAESDLASNPVQWVRGRLFQLWYSVLAIAFVAVLPLPLPVTLAVFTAVIMVHAIWSARSFRKLDRALPGGYLKQQLTDPTRGRAGFRAYCAAGALLLPGGVLVALVPGPGTTAGDILLVLTAVVLGVGLLSVEKALARLVVADHAEDRRRRDYQLVRFGDNASRYRPYWLAALAGVVLMMVTASTGGDATGGAGMLSVGILWTVKTVDLVLLSRTLPGGENPWVAGLALTQYGRGRQAVRGRLMGVRFLLLMLFVSFFTTFVGFGAFSGGFVDGS
ncbi:hypothetical protein GM708_15515 [Vibrio cholerae]|nr:hypothetical protein [Vibrio cholerae]